MLQINEEEAELVREIFDRYEGGKYGPAIGMKKIVALLNAKCLRRGARWTIQNVQFILSDIAYTGVYLSGGRYRYKKVDDAEADEVEEAEEAQEDNAPIPVSVPVIIEPERFARLAVIRTARSPRKMPPAPRFPTLATYGALQVRAMRVFDDYHDGEVWPLSVLEVQSAEFDFEYRLQQP